MDGWLLKSKIILKGLKLMNYLERVNKGDYIMDRNRYYRCIGSDHEFNRKEIQAMREVLNLTDTYFF